MLKNVLLGAVIPIVLVVSGIALLVGLQAETPPTEELPAYNKAALLSYLPPADIEMVRALAEKSDTLNINVSGTVVPYRELQLAAESSGRIVEKDQTVRSGNYVKKGQLLFRIDPRDYELEIERLTRRRDQELAAIVELQQDVENTKSLMEIADQELKLAEADVRRFENMSANFSSAAELDEARRKMLSSMNQRVNLQNQIRAYQATASRLELATKLAETELEKARLDLARTEVRAPADGRVVMDQVEVDSFVQRGTSLLMIEDTEKVEVSCNIRMDQLYWILDQPNLSTDQLVNAAQASRFELPPTPVTVTFEVTGRESMRYQWKGVLDRFDGTGLDPQSRTIPIRIRVDNPRDVSAPDGNRIDMGGAPMLVRGMFVEVDIQARPTTQLMLVPKLSIKPASQNNVVWKFRQDDQAVFTTPIALAAKEASSNPKTEGETTGSKSQEAEQVDAIVADDWLSGYLEIITGVRLVTSYWGDAGVEYWVCEVPVGTLGPGDFVITTPLPGIKADGTDPVRVEKANMNQVSGELAATQEEDGQS